MNHVSDLRSSKAKDRVAQGEAHMKALIFPVMAIFSAHAPPCSPDVLRSQPWWTSIPPALTAR
jgi:hypothetical protein